MAEGRDDYYRESEGPPGQWVGGLADRLDVAGEATVEEFGRLLDGRVNGPDAEAFDGADRRKVLAFDMAFSAPKSVSLLRIAADESTSRVIDRAHDRAVRAAFGTLEREAADYNQMTDGRRGTHRSSDGLVGVLYRHETTRNADPQLHSHVVAMNVVRRADGSYSSLNNRQLYRLAKTAGSVYQAVLRGELGRDLGLEFDVPVNGLADVKGFDRELIERYSTRRAELVEALRAKGLEGAGRYAAEASALETRRAKDMQLDHAAWRGEMRQALERDGLVPERVAELVGGPGERPPVRSLAERLASVDLEDLTDRQAHVDGGQVVQRGLDIADGISADEVQDAIDRILRDDRIAQVQDGAPTDLRSQRFTTRQHLELEQEVSRLTVDRSSAGADPRTPVVGRETVEELRAAQVSPIALSVAQEHVAEELLTSGRGFELVSARAGAGKTTVAGVVRERFEAAGYDVVGLAPTHQAVAEMRDSGIKELETLAKVSYQDGQFSRIVGGLSERSVVVIDEAGMAQTGQVAPLLRRAAEVGAKVIAIGDDRQLAAVGAGGWFRHAVEHDGATTLHLGEVHRQQGATQEEGQVERSRLGLLHAGDAGPWLRWAERSGRLGVCETVEDGYREVLDRYRQALDANPRVDDVAVLVPTNVHRRQLNELLRRELVERRLLDTGGQREIGGQLVTPGDRLVSSRNLRDEHGRELVRNGERFTAVAVNRSGVRAVATAGHREGQTVRLPADMFGGQAPAIEHAYARTVHKAQGITTQRVVVFAPRIDGLSSNLAYVALSRTRARTDLVTVGNDRRGVLEQLQRRLQVRGDHEMAWSLVQRDRLRPGGGPSLEDLEEHREALMHELVDAGTQVQQHQARERARAEANQARVRGAGLQARRDQRGTQLAEALLDVAEHRQERDEDLVAGRRPRLSGYGRDDGDAALRALLNDVVELDEQIADNARGPVERGPAHLRGVEQVHRDLLEDLAHVNDLLAGEQQLGPGQALQLDVEAAGRLGGGEDPQVARWLRERFTAHEQRNAPEKERGSRELHELAPAWQRELVQLARDARAAREALSGFLAEHPFDVEELARRRAGERQAGDEVATARKRLETAEAQRPTRRRDRRDWARGIEELQRQVEQLAERHRAAGDQVRALEDEMPAGSDPTNVLERRDALRTAADRAAGRAAGPRQEALNAIARGEWARAQHPAVYRGLGERPKDPVPAQRWDTLAARITDRHIERDAGGDPDRVQPAQLLQRDVERYRTDVDRGPDATDRGRGRGPDSPTHDR
ncbi:MAG: relaxase domain-containing protein [Solirubrobacteraceae bacterium]|nr:relaxase domain-containing protein [Solirubrobacteraceae bacterium]